MSRGLLLLGAGGGATAFSPDQISGLVLWLKADSLVLSDGDPVASWTDSSGQGNDVSQATAAKKPTYKSSILNSKPVVRFDGVDDLLVRAVSGFRSADSAGTLFIVLVYSSGLYLFTSADEAFNNIYGINIYVETGNAKSEQRNDDTADIVAGSSTIGTSLIALVSSGTAYTMFVNGATEGLTVESGANNGDWFADTPGRDNFVLGALKILSGEAYFVACDMAEVLLYSSALSTADRQSVESHLNSKYAIY